MEQKCDTRFELQPVFRSTVPDVAHFLHRWGSTEEGSGAHGLARESVSSIERRLKWLLSDNPLINSEIAVGYCLRDNLGTIRGVVLCFPAAFLLADKRLLGLCSGSFFVEANARSMGFYLFKKYLKTPGYSFQFASTCNTYSSELWRAIGASPVPNSDTEYFLPIRLDMVVAAYVAYKTSSQAAARIARMCSRSANPILRFLARPSAKFSIEPCWDWEKLSDLSRRHRCPDYITTDRSPAFLQWRYGRGSPSHPCNIYLFRDERGNEGWFALGHVNRGKICQLRTTVLLDAVWPRKQMNYSDVFEEILRVTAATTDAISFRWQPGLDYQSYNRWIIPRKLGTPRAFVSVPKGSSRFALDSFDYDDSDYIAWGFQWAEG
ncbi:MAG: hypothetical protein JOZ45_02855 [Acidobacteriaceae bacterium]|nr:hypothetical protein [Acidobacteriaceae bacterium]MBV9226833.1 hypothetical protein [Acidobacteriaceae bacterium]MBV9305049.1 hypothetical protein [Acidobacteriaceae bacterium]